MEALKRIENRKINIKITDKKAYFIIAVFVSIILLLLSPFSPIIKGCYCSDAICFKIMSCGWLTGKIPYRDLFDHKGPLTYLVYMIGFKISNFENWGAWIVMLIVNEFTYIYAYKVARLRFNVNVSLLSTVILLSMIVYASEKPYLSFFSTGSHPDNIVVLLLILSTYIYVGAIVSSNNIKEQIVVFSSRQMFLLGLFCGMVFMIKLNFCAIYFLFIAPYYLWLIIKKKLFICIKQIALFWLGIALVVLPFVVYFWINNALKDFIDIYFVFNYKYSKYVGNSQLFFWKQEKILTEGKILLAIFFVLALISFLNNYKKARFKVQFVIYNVLSLIFYAIFTHTLIFSYMYVVFVPFLILIIADIVNVFNSRIKDISNCIILTILIVIVCINSMFLFSLVDYRNAGCSEVLDDYIEQHPNPSASFLGVVCQAGVYDKSKSWPDAKYFYHPPIINRDFYKLQIKDLKNTIPDIVIFTNWKDGALDSIVDLEDDIIDFLEEKGYKMIENIDKGDLCVETWVK